MSEVCLGCFGVDVCVCVGSGWGGVEVGGWSEGRVCVWMCLSVIVTSWKRSLSNI